MHSIIAMNLKLCHFQKIVKLNQLEITHFSMNLINFLTFSFANFWSFNKFKQDESSARWFYYEINQQVMINFFFALIGNSPNFTFFMHSLIRTPKKFSILLLNLVSKLSFDVSEPTRIWIVKLRSLNNSSWPILSSSNVNFGTLKYSDSM